MLQIPRLSESDRGSWASYHSCQNKKFYDQKGSGKGIQSIINKLADYEYYQSEVYTSKIFPISPRETYRQIILSKRREIKTTVATDVKIINPMKISIFGHENNSAPSLK